MENQLNIGISITQAPNMLWHYMMHQWIALYISFPSMYGSAMETSPEKIFLHNIPNIRYITHYYPELEINEGYRCLLKSFVWISDLVFDNILFRE